MFDETKIYMAGDPRAAGYRAVQHDGALALGRARTCIYQARPQGGVFRQSVECLAGGSHCATGRRLTGKRKRITQQT